MNRNLLLIIIGLITSNILSIDTIFEFKKNINELNNLKNSVKVKEKQLNNLKMKVGKSAWNFLDRSNNETIIQNKNKLIKELNALYLKIKNTEDILINNRDNFIIKINENITNQEYFNILNFIDDLYFEYLLSIVPKTEYIITDVELLKKNNQLIKNYLIKVKNFIVYLDLKLFLIKKFNINYDINIIDNQIKTFNNIYNSLNK